MQQLVQSAALGRDAYERWVLWKRTLLPMALVPLAVACAGFVRRFPPGVVVGTLLFAAWAAVRVLDASANTLGVEAAAATYAIGAALLAAWSWRR